MPRVFHLIKSLGRGGAEMLLAEGLRFSDRSKFEYGYGYFLPWKNALATHLADQQADVVCFRAANTISIFLAAKRVSNHLRRWEADLLHCHLPLAGVVGRLAARMARIPVVYTEHNRMERYHPLTRRANLLTWAWQDRVIAVSSEVAASIRAHTDGRTPIRIILNGVDTERFDPDHFDTRRIRHELGISPGSPVVGTVAVFRVQKRLEDWLQAARLLRDQHPEIRFLIVGDGPLKNDLEERTRELGLADITYFPGLQENVGPYLAAMNVFMMSSLFEGLPVALLEAMAMRCGIVATRVGGIPEVIRDGENGSLVDPLHPEELANAASRLLDDPLTAVRFGIQARCEVAERLSMQRMMLEIENLYEEVLRNGKTE